MQTNDGNLPDATNDDKLKGQANLNQDSHLYCYEDYSIETPSQSSESCTRRSTQPTKNPLLRRTIILDDFRNTDHNSSSTFLLTDDMDTIDSWDDKVSTSSMLEYQISLTDKTKYDTLSYSPTVHERNSDEFTQLSDYSFDTQINDNISLDSARCSMISVGSVCTNSLNADKATKSFLQLKGVCIANYYMGCNFNIAATLQLMIQYELSVLAIQEHTPWNRELSLMEMA